jgi:hypothetical protein
VNPVHTLVVERGNPAQRWTVTMPGLGRCLVLLRSRPAALRALAALAAEPIDWAAATPGPRGAVLPPESLRRLLDVQCRVVAGEFDRPPS